jgi:hypothetical protein
LIFGITVDALIFGITDQWSYGSMDQSIIGSLESMDSVESVDSIYFVNSMVSMDFMDFMVSEDFMDKLIIGSMENESMDQ